MRNAPHPRGYVPSAQYETATQRKRYRIQVGNGIVMWINEIGNGKTLLSLVMLLKPPQSRYTIGLVSHGTVPENEVHGGLLPPLRLDPSRSAGHVVKQVPTEALHRQTYTVTEVMS